MITGVHALIYSREADAVRAFFREVLGRDYVDDGDGWLIFAMPPAELAVHPTDGESRHELYLMCDDIQATVGELRAKGVECGEVADQGWGLLTSVKLADGEEMGLYEPRHASPLAQR